MNLVHVHSRVVLDSFTKTTSPSNAHLSNAAKQIYKLDVLSVDPNKAEIRFRLPSGRRAPIDPTDEWTLLLRNDQGAYQANLVKVIPQNDALVCTVPIRMQFLARRKNIRLQADSLRPIRIQFKREGQQEQGQLVDFSLDGLGILMPPKTACRVGMTLHEGQFELRGYQVRFQTAEVVHCHREVDGCRIGVRFTQLSDDQTEIIRKTFDAWYLSHRPSFSESSEFEG